MRPSRSWSEGRHHRQWAHRAAARFADDRGQASLEFLTVGVILLVPLVYLVVAVSVIQAGALGVEGAARQAARVAALAADHEASDVAVDRAVRVTLGDYGVDPAAASVSISCDRRDCLEPGARVSVSVLARVELPLVPDLLALDAVGSVPITATATQTVSRFATGAP